MNSRTFITHILLFVLFIFLQVIFTRNFTLFGYGFCFVYIAAILLLPMEMNHVMVILLAFATGLLIDLFYNTLGIHAAASVLLAFLRPSMLKILTPAGGYESYMRIAVSSMGLRWYLMFMIPLVFVHHFTLFMIEYAQITQMLYALAKALASTALSLIVIIMVQSLFYAPSNKV